MTPTTLKEFMAQRKEAAARKVKRQAKAVALGHVKTFRPKSKTIGQLEAVLWDLFSLFIRLRDKKANNGLCFYCEKRTITCAAHRIKRGKRATKYDERNSDGACDTCNFEDGPGNQSQKFDAIFIKKKGVDLFLELEAKSREFCPRTRVDILAKTAHYRAKLQEAR